MRYNIGTINEYWGLVVKANTELTEAVMDRLHGMPLEARPQDTRQLYIGAEPFGESSMKAKDGEANQVRLDHFLVGKIYPLPHIGTDSEQTPVGSATFTTRQRYFNWLKYASSEYMHRPTPMGQAGGSSMDYLKAILEYKVDGQTSEVGQFMKKFDELHEKVWAQTWGKIVAADGWLDGKRREPKDQPHTTTKT